MFSGTNNPFLQTPGKVVMDIKRGRMPSGQVVEIRCVEVTLMENGLWRKEKVQEIQPGLADGSTPQRIADIRECCICLGLFCKDHIRSCPRCGRDYCLLWGCSGQVELPDEGPVIMCAFCAKEANTSFLKRFFQRFWSIGT